MTLGVYIFILLSVGLTCYMLGVSDGKIEGRIESFQEKR